MLFSESGLIDGSPFDTLFELFSVFRDTDITLIEPDLC
jgi:hypothetical protein